MGRRHHRLSPAADRCAELHAQPRGSRQGAGGGHQLRRAADAGGGPGRPLGLGARLAGFVASRKPTAIRARRRSTWCCRRARSWSPPAPSPTPCSAREEPQHVTLDGKYFQAYRRDGHKVTPERVTKPAAAHVLMRLRAGRPRHQLLRRPAPVLRRQRRQGDGERQAGLSGGQPDAGAAAAVRDLAERRWSRGSTTSCAPPCTRSTGSRPTIVEVVVRAPMAARAFQPGQFYRLQNYETLGAQRRRHHAGHGGARAHRRLGRPRAAACCRRSCSRWAARPTCARSSRPASRWC